MVQGRRGRIILLGDIVDKPIRSWALAAPLICRQIHGLKNGAPPRCDLEKERGMHNTLRGFIYSGLVKSAHDCSDGGLAVALAESCISQQIARDTPAPDWRAN